MASRSSSSDPKGSAVPWTNRAGVRSSGKKAVRFCSGFFGGCKRVGEQQQAVGQAGPFGGEHGGLPAAVGMAAGEDAARRDGAHGVHGCAMPSRSRTRGNGKGRAFGTLCAEGQVEAQYEVAPVREARQPASRAAARRSSSPRRA